jgi:hypothetical protein
MNAREELIKAARAVLATIESTGGLVDFEDGTIALAVDPDWLDLADAALALQKALEANGERVELTRKAY